MKRLAVVPLLLVLGVIGSVGIASAGSSKHDLGLLLRIHGTPAPAEWAGIWETKDSTYTCAGQFQSYVVDTDTVCAGQTFDPPPDQEFPIDCTGSADGTSYHMHCTGTGPVFTDCDATFDFTVDGTRTNETARIVIVSSFSFSGTAEGCSFTQCTREVSYQTRLGPAPTEYCTTTEVKRSSWGQLKILYR